MRSEEMVQTCYKNRIFETYFTTTLLHGVMQCTDGANYDSLCRAQCDPGYDLLGSRARRCQWSGHWSGVEMICQQITCPSFTRSVRN